ncbi:hypothetical protein H6G91_32085 [Nostoc muscorum FACHB-395]|nr:hypothetical protein [Desmonostoc muscorum FACHB-395]
MAPNFCNSSTIEGMELRLSFLIEMTYSAVSIYAFASERMFEKLAVDDRMCGMWDERKGFVLLLRLADWLSVFEQRL